MPAEVRADSVRAVRAHPGGVLPSAAEYYGGAGGRVEACWARDGGDTARCPGQAGVLSAGVRALAAWPRSGAAGGVRRSCGRAGCGARLGSGGRGAAVPGSPGRAAGADRAGRARGPQPSDYDPQPPVKVQEQRLSEEGAAGDYDEKAPIELDEDTQRLAGLVREEEQQRWARLANRDNNDPPENL